MIIAVIAKSFLRRLPYRTMISKQMLAKYSDAVQIKNFKEVSSAKKVQLQHYIRDKDEFLFDLINEYDNELNSIVDENECELDNHVNIENTETSIQLEPLACTESKNDLQLRSLLAFIDVYVVIDKPIEALQTLEFYRLKSKGLKMFNDVTVFNILMNGFAEKTNWHKLKHVFNLILVAKLKPNIQSFVPVFECFGRFQNMENGIHPKSDINDFLNLFHEKFGFNFNELMDQGVFIGKQKHFVTEFIKSIEPNFVEHYSLPDLQYSSSLTNKLNDSSQYNLNNLNALKDPNAFLTSDQLQKLFQKQLENETKGFIEVKSIEKKSMNSEHVDRCRKILKSMLEEWKIKLQNAFKREINILKAQNSIKHNSFIVPMDMKPYLLCLDEEQYVQVMLMEVRRLAEGSESYSSGIHQLYRNVLRKKKLGAVEKLSNIYVDYCDLYSAKNLISSLNGRQMVQMLEFSKRKSGADFNLEPVFWPNHVLLSIGKFLYNLIIMDLRINVNSLRKDIKNKNYQPAFYSLYRHQGKLIREEIKPHPVLCKLWRESQQESFLFPVNLVPMICPPLPWCSVTNGGYLIAHSDVIRLSKYATQHWKRLTETSVVNLYPSLDSLNALASVPWQVNKFILNIILEVFNNGGNIKLNVPPPASSHPALLTTNDKNEKLDKYQMLKQIFQMKRKKAEMHSLWCDALYRISLANHFKNEIFWMPHNMDFRGRVYPVPPHLCHLGSDLARSMLVFAVKKPLGSDGLKWLKLHLVNLLGTKKSLCIEDRLDYINDQTENIMDSADNPLNGKKWWMDAEEPWQALSCCCEITNALRHPQGPEAYISGFPIHQDGSCNGLQHYAALGRDQFGAYSVNLMPAHAPQDVYSTVAKLVEEARSKEAQKGNEAAIVLEGFIRRKVVKQTVMTTVYGVTKFGAKAQIAKQLRDIEDFPKGKIWSCSVYLTTKTFESIRSMFTSAKEIQDWLTECARMISTSCHRNVEWITPLGLPVVQPYIELKKNKKKNASNLKTIIELHLKPNTVKQKNAFPPNFIHSLDSCHMMLTSIFCERQNLNFVSVHDCFWTHPIDASKMNEICREQFIALHSRPILENLSEFLIQNYSEPLNSKQIAVIKKIPKKGDFNIKDVMHSVYFFS